MPLDRDRRQLLAALVAVLGCVVLLTGVPSRASAAALSGAAWSASSTLASATGVAYTFLMTPRTGATLSKVTMTVPSGTSGTPAVGTVLPSLPAGSAVSLSGTLLTYTFSPVSVPAGLALSLQFTGLKNTATAGTYTSTITTSTATATVDTGTASFTFGGNAMTGTPSWTASSTVTGAANTSYTYTFTPNNLLDGLAIGTITISVPPGTSGTPGIGAYSPALSTVNSVSLSGSLLTISYSPGLLNALSAISITITGLTNTFTAGSYVPEIVLSNGGGLIGTGVAPAVTFPGTLTLGAPATLTWAGTLNGQNQALADPAAADQLLTVNDQTDSQAGWHVTVSATNFVTSGGAVLPPSGVLTVNGSLTAAGATAAPTAACSGTAACTPSTSTVTYPAVITSAASSPPATTVYSTPAGTGIGLVALGSSAAANPLGWWVHVPGYASSGSYSSTVTVSVISGP